MPTIYRQYRPQRFADVSGQPHIIDTLKAAITKNQISHAYLFQGPRGTGKTSTARIFAKRLNCTQATDAEPCEKCPSCIAASAHKNIDVVEIDAASNRGIDNIRALREHSSLSPSMSTYKIYIIDEVHMLSHDAFPALLKTLEEPTPHVVFILATTELHKVPQTILSRCQVYRFRRATEAEMRTRLTHILQAEKREAQPEVIDFIISRSDGCYRDAESLLGQLLVTEEKNISTTALTQLLGLPSPTLITEFLSALVEQNISQALNLLDSAYAQGFDPEQLINECTRTARDTLVALAKGDTSSALSKLPNSNSRLTAIVRALVQAMADLAYVPQPLIAIQLAILTVCQTASNKPAAAISTPQPQSITAPAPKPFIKPIIPIKKPEPVAQAVTITTSTPQQKPVSENGVVTIDQIKAVWDKLINAIKKSNPVASTFLRAVEPSIVSGTEITLRVAYPLHRTFFEKPDNKAMIEKNLMELLAQPVIQIRYHMDSDAPLPVMKKNSGAAVQDTSDSLHASVKEVFG